MRPKQTQKKRDYQHVGQNPLLPSKARKFLFPWAVLLSIAILIALLFHYYNGQTHEHILKDSNEMPSVKNFSSIPTEDLDINYYVEFMRYKQQGNKMGKVRILQRFNRDLSEIYYTQGLMFMNETTLLESAGMNKHSSIHTININEPNKVQLLTKNKDEEFGEGCDVIDGMIYQILWQHRYIYQYDPKTLSIVTNSIPLDYHVKEGWGLTHRVKDSQTEIFLTDGSNNVYVADQNFKVQNTIPIFFANGTQTKYLNELEYANNLLYANIYLTNFIVAIDIDQGNIQKQIYFANWQGFLIYLTYSAKRKMRVAWQQAIGETVSMGLLTTNRMNPSGSLANIGLSFGKFNLNDSVFNS